MPIGCFRSGAAAGMDILQVARRCEYYKETSDFLLSCQQRWLQPSKKMQKVKTIYRLLPGGTPSQRLGCQFKRLTFWNRDLEVGTVKWGPGTVR